MGDDGLGNLQMKDLPREVQADEPAVGVDFPGWRHGRNSLVEMRAAE
jgi:hypothetical protein